MKVPRDQSRKETQKALDREGWEGDIIRHSTTVPRSRRKSASHVTKDLTFFFRDQFVFNIRPQAGLAQYNLSTRIHRVTKLMQLLLYKHSSSHE